MDPDASWSESCWTNQDSSFIQDQSDPVGLHVVKSPSQEDPEDLLQIPAGHGFWWVLKWYPAEKRTR